MPLPKASDPGPVPESSRRKHDWEALGPHARLLSLSLEDHLSGPFRPTLAVRPHEVGVTAVRTDA
jgi:hypothetical protein